MERTKETLEARVRETPLVDRLKECQKRIGNMCAELRGPKMSIPVEYYDDDFYICTTLADAQATIAALQAIIKQMGEQACVLAKDGMTAKAQVEALQAQVARAKESCRCYSNWWDGKIPERPSYEVLQQQVEALQREHTQLQALMRALPDCPGEIKVYPPAVGVICGTYDVRYDFHLESGSFQSIRLAMFHDECEADTYADLLKYRATLDATTPAQTDEQRCIEACCERPHDCKWGGTGGCGYEGRKPKGGDGE